MISFKPVSALPLLVCLAASVVVFFLGQFQLMGPENSKIFLSIGAAGFISCLGLSELYRQQTEREARQLREVSTIDSLTGAGNRRYFEAEVRRRIGQYRYYQSRCAFLLLDVDHFKLVNDKRGHWVGDNVLRQVCKTINANIRDVDMLFRIGGEEFVVLLPETSLFAATITAERVRKAVESDLTENQGETFGVTVSIGVSEISNNDTLELLMIRADKALYASKGAGRNCVYVADKSNPLGEIAGALYLSKCERDLEFSPESLPLQISVDSVPAKSRRANLA
ncbi:MAG: GGDEF domain-containing protein [Pirellulaceae bacterium]|nr:GGDEF domain-containing protein [Pirellulaceae bacterium]